MSKRSDRAAGGLLKFESRVSSIKNGRIRCFLLIQLKLETKVLILETGVFKLETRVLIIETRYSIEHNTRAGCGVKKIKNGADVESADCGV